MATCRDCETALVAPKDWRRMTLAQRAESRAAGRHRSGGWGCCEPCYNRRRRLRQRPDDVERKQVPAVAVLEDWRMLADRELSRAENVRRLAPRMGMTEAALAKALERAVRRGELAA